MSTNSREYQQKWREEHQEKIAEYKRREGERRKEESRNKPAAPGVKGRGRQNTGFMDVAYSIENTEDDLTRDINFGKYMEGNVNE